MKEPTREQILERMVKNIIRECVNENNFVLTTPFDFYYDDAKTQLIKELNPLLTKKQKEHLEEDINYMQLASKHSYYAVSHHQVSINFYGGGMTAGEVRFFYKNHQGIERYDTIAGNPCYTEKMVKGVKYSVEELLA